MILYSCNAHFLMASVTGVKKSIKAGSSDVITVTKDLQSLKLSPGEEVCVWMARPTLENQAILKILDLSDKGEYGIMNRQWLLLANNNQFDDPSNYLDEETIAEIDDLETIQHTMLEVLNKFLKARCNSGLFYYSDELSSFVRTFEPIGKGSNGSTRTDRDKVRFESLVLDFIYDLLYRLHMNKSPLRETRGMVESLEKARSTYRDLLQSDPDDGTLRSRLDILNTEWENRQKAIARIYGTFIVIIDLVVEHGDGLRHKLRPTEVRLQNTYSRNLLNRSIASELDYLKTQSNQPMFPSFKVLGPMKEGSADVLADYLRMGIQLNFPDGPSYEMFSWCENQYESFMANNHDSEEDDE